MKKLLITGGNGQLAQSFSSLFNSKFQIQSLGRHQLDITKKNEVELIKDQFQPDIILNCAAYTDVDGSENNFQIANRVNAEAMNNLLVNFKGIFIHISTDYIFNGKNGPYKEDDSADPINKYGLSKLNGEKIAQSLSNNLFIIRANVIFDINFKSSFLDWIINSLKQNKSISVVNDQIGNPIWSEDLAKIIYKLITNEKPGVYHAGTDKLISRYKFAQMIADEWGLNKKLIYPITTSQLMKKIESYVAPRPLNSGLIVSEKISPISLQESLKKIRK